MNSATRGFGEVSERVESVRCTSSHDVVSSARVEDGNCRDGLRVGTAVQEAAAARLTPQDSVAQVQMRVVHLKECSRCAGRVSCEGSRTAATTAAARSHEASDLGQSSCYGLEQVIISGGFRKIPLSRS